MLSVCDFAIILQFVNQSPLNSLFFFISWDRGSRPQQELRSKPGVHFRCCVQVIKGRAQRAIIGVRSNPSLECLIPVAVDSIR